MILELVFAVGILIGVTAGAAIAYFDIAGLCRPVTAAESVADFRHFQFTTRRIARRITRGGSR